jgi:rare lipoprotein A
MARLAIVVAMFVLATSPALAKINHHGEPGAEYGIASTYSLKLVGHTTASGETLDRKRMTAAHTRLPFGTRLVVTNKRNGRKVIVTINDRGPYKKGRIIDLSPAAAAQLGMQRAGLAPVEIRLALATE